MTPSAERHPRGGERQADSGEQIADSIVTIDNALYDRLADSWWHESGFLNALKALNPARFGYMRRVLEEELRIDPRGLRALDVGCGGGLLAEEFARVGCRVTGIDPSEPSLAAARAHARTEGLDIDYRQGSGEALPFPDASFDLVYCCDVLEHVKDLSRVITEIARVLRPGAVFFYDTINRTFMSKLIVIKLFQEWRSTAFMEPNLHDWNMFVTPEELECHLRKAGLVPSAITGLKARANPLRVIQALRARKRGELTYYEAARLADFGESTDTSVSYIGYARSLKPVA